MENTHNQQLGPRGPVVMAVCLGALGLIACGDEPEARGGTSQALSAECLTADASAPPDSWVCPNELSVECNDGSGSASVETIYAHGAEPSCVDPLHVDPGPFSVGDHPIVVRGGDNVAVCSTVLHVTDSVAPTLTTKTLFLWPPNHKFHSIAVEDCATVQDACRADLQAEFVWASSDEPVDDLGDGHHAPDIMVDADCRHVQLRAERQGPKDGRVYKLGVRVVDGTGHATEGVCTVIVDHDQRGVDGSDSGEAYRITLNGQDGAPACDGVNPPPPAQGTPDAGVPPVVIPEEPEEPVIVD